MRSARSGPNLSQSWLPSANVFSTTRDQSELTVRIFAAPCYDRSCVLTSALCGITYLSQTTQTPKTTGGGVHVNRPPSQSVHVHCAPYDSPWSMPLPRSQWTPEDCSGPANPSAAIGGDTGITRTVREIACRSSPPITKGLCIAALTFRCVDDMSCTYSECSTHRRSPYDVQGWYLRSRWRWAALRATANRTPIQYSDVFQIGPAGVAAPGTAFSFGSQSNPGEDISTVSQEHRPSNVIDHVPRVGASYTRPLRGGRFLAALAPANSDLLDVRGRLDSGVAHDPNCSRARPLSASSHIAVPTSDNPLTLFLS